MATMDNKSKLQINEANNKITNEDEIQTGKDENNEGKTIINNTTNNNNYEHDPAPEAGTRCRCGCVPDMMSLFEMAALRAKKKKEKKDQELKLKLLQQEQPI